MAITEKDVFLHRANSPRGDNTPVEQLQEYSAAGFYRFEVDIYTPTVDTYKFCHALDAQRVEETHVPNDGYIESVVAAFPNAEWLVDLKCLDIPELPKETMNHLVRAFGGAAIYIGARQNTLEYYHEQGVRTGQYFYANEEPAKLSFEPDFYMQSVDGELTFPAQKVIYS